MSTSAGAHPSALAMTVRDSEILREPEDGMARVLAEAGATDELGAVIFDIAATINSTYAVGLGLTPDLGRPMPTTADAAAVRELVDQIEERPFVFAVRFLNLERACERLQREPRPQVETEDTRCSNCGRRIATTSPFGICARCNDEVNARPERF